MSTKYAKQSANRPTNQHPLVGQTISADSAEETNQQADSSIVFLLETHLEERITQDFSDRLVKREESFAAHDLWAKQDSDWQRATPYTTSLSCALDSANFLAHYTLHDSLSNGAGRPNLDNMKHYISELEKCALDRIS
ncbi:hypothetical protein PG984_010236 [Apiospora sp. TS-2023a]